MLLALLLWVADAFVGHLVYFRAQGLVVSDAAELASEYTATVDSVSVDRGQRVEKGEEVARLRSQAVSERIARIAADIVAAQGRLSEVVADREARERLLVEARDRLARTRAMREQYEGAAERNLLTGAERLDIGERYYSSLREVETLQGTIQGLKAEAEALRTRLRSAEQALADLRAGFDDGALRAPWSGLVIDIAVVEGSVVTPGEPIVRVAEEDGYVLAYRPTGTLYDIAVGERVTVSTGVSYYAARIAEILPLTAELPPAFQQSFKPTRRQQVMRIVFTDERPPLFASVSVSRPGWWVLNRIRSGAVDLANWLEGLVGDAAAGSAG